MNTGSNPRPDYYLLVAWAGRGTAPARMRYGAFRDAFRAAEATSLTGLWERVTLYHVLRTPEVTGNTTALATWDRGERDSVESQRAQQAEELEPPL